ncbi:MAG: release factor glutamine methyltransferase [Solirubrobacteraceae bacterium]|jgi:release factor glutamine methyltransferase|nr:release factor glutamine methyltransferase [Solirubrobacteraceae bacterium]
MPRAPLARTSVRDALDSAVIALGAAGCETPRLDAEVLLADVLAEDRAALIAHPGRELEPAEARAFQDAARRRSRREPVAYIVGRRGFRRLELEVDARVLVPRPETEHLVEAALGLPHGASVVDVGTGSGAVALALKDERPDLQLTGTDASADAVAVARANGARLGLEVRWREGDLLAGVAAADAVVSNPPYVAVGTRVPAELGFEPVRALLAGETGYELYDRLAPAAAASGASFAAFEVGIGQAGGVAERLRAAGFREIEVMPDLAGIERVVIGRR